MCRINNAEVALVGERSSPMTPPLSALGLQKKANINVKIEGRGHRGKDASGASLDATHLIASDGRHPKGALTVGFPTTNVKNKGRGRRFPYHKC